MRSICLKGTVQSLTLTLSCFFCPHKIFTDFFIGEKSQQIVVIVKIYISNYFKFVQGHFFQYNYIGSTEDLILHPRKSSI